MTVNPFSTSQVAPGRIPWIPANGQDLGLIATNFLSLPGRAAAIVGPHGSGKSTLLCSLQPWLGSLKYRQNWAGQEEFIDDQGGVLWLQLRRRSIPSSQLARSRKLWQPDDILIIDGFEQLPWFRRVFLRYACRREKLRLLVTSHRCPFSMPCLLRTSVDVNLASTVVARLMDGPHQESPQKQKLDTKAWTDPRKLSLLLDEQNGNLREVLMSLFDEYQAMVRRENHTELQDNQRRSLAYPRQSSHSNPCKSS